PDRGGRVRAAPVGRAGSGHGPAEARGRPAHPRPGCDVEALLDHPRHERGGQRRPGAPGPGGIFGYPKPVELLRVLIESQTWNDPDALIMDFFAGSGTTAEAVLRANLRDGGRRRFILVQ